MQITFDANKKKLDTNPVFGLLVQGENLAESIQITGPKMVGALDLSQLRVAVRMTSGEYETTVEKTLEQTTDGDTITLTWEVDKQFTCTPGKVDVMLVGYGGNEEVIKITSSGMVVKEDKVFGTAPPESTWEKILQQMQDFATQAYESKTEAENSAAVAAESQRVTEEKAAQATEAASTAAAQAAAKTEQQIRQYADDRYARPLVTKTGPAASLEVYPDKLSNLKVYANGFTTQAGTGDPSPTNVRALTCGGLKLVELVLTGAENWSMSGTTYPRFYFTLSKPAPANWTNTVACTIFKPNNILNEENKPGIGAYGKTLYLRESQYNDSVEALKADLSAKYAAGNPEIVWYVPADESDATGLYAPIVLQSGEYRATCLPMTAPLCEGDSVVSWAKSGCDKQLTLDGSTLTVAASDSNYTVVAANAVAGGTVYASGLAGLSLTAGSITIPSTAFPPSVTNAGQANTWLQSNPQMLYYQSTAYTEAADIPVSLETHQQAVLVLDGTENFLKTVGQENIFQISNLFPGKNFTANSSHYKNGGNAWKNMPNYSVLNSANYLGFKDERFDTAEEFKVYLAEQYAAGTPVTIVYQLATPITYAHEAVVLPALPDNTGKVTITGQSGGTVTVVFNKSIIKEIAEIKAAMLAMGANLSV